MRRATITNSLTKGVLDPDLAERTDLAHLWQSLFDAVNGVATPQGGFRDRGGFLLAEDADVLAAGFSPRQRRRLEPVHLTVDMVTAISGGSTADLVDQDATTEMAVGTVGVTPFPAVEIDLGQPVAVAAIDVERFSCSGDPIDECLAVEYFLAGAWHAFGGSADNAARKHIRTTARSRRFAGAPGIIVTAQHWRVALHGAVGAGDISIGGLKVWSEGEALSPVMHVTMARSNAERYNLILTDRNIDVHKGLRWQAAIAVPVAGQQIAELWPEPSLDTLVLFHEDIETLRIERQGSDGEWDAGLLPWTNTPLLTKGTAFAGNTDEIQDLDMTGVVDGDQVSLLLGGLIAAPIVYTAATFAADAAAAIGQLPGVTAGDILVTARGGAVWRVQFVDANGSRAWPLLTAIAAGRAVQPVTSIAQRGLAADGDMWGATTGYARCGRFVQSRLLTGGYRSAPTTWGVSRVGQYFDHQTTSDPMTADLAFFRTLDTDQVETILAVYIGRHLIFFTEGGEWYVETRTFDALQPVNVVRASSHGVRSGVNLAFADGAVLFVQKGGQTVRDMLWADVEQSYKAEPINLLAPHLLTDVVSLAHRQARSVKEGNQILMANADGSAVSLTLLRSQEVQALVPWRLAAGAFRAFAVDVDHDTYCIAEMAGDLRLLRRTADLPLDYAVHYQGAAATVIGGLAHLEGRADVWAFADDELVGPLTVTGGTITLPVAAADVWAGLAPEFFGTGQVLRERPNEAPPFRLPARIYEIEFDVAQTGALSFAVNGKPFQDIPLTRADDRFLDGGPQQTVNGGAPQLPLMQRRYTGKVRRQGMPGWSRHPFIAFSRPYPAPVHIRSIRYEVANRG